MQIPLQITYIRMHSSEALDANIRDHAAQLDQRYGRITSCRVVVEAPHRHKRKGMLYHVRVDITMPGREIVASREPPLNKSHEDLYVAIRDAFNAVRRRLEEHARRQRGRVKEHEVIPHGRIRRMFRDRDFGFIETPDEHEIYFHSNSILNAGFQDLKPGDEVRYCEEDGISGPQASSVSAVGKHHIAA